MNKPTELGMNRTGIQMSPKDASDVIQQAQKIPADPKSGRSALESVRREYISESDPVGKVPIPGTVKGAVKSTMQKLTGKRPEVFADRLAQRLAFERTGVRLYDALIAKCEAQAVVGRMRAPGFSIEVLRRFREEERNHFLMVWNAMEQLGLDPTAMTPAANIDGVAASGLVQALSDPRTSVDECLNVILIAELADNDGWDMLISLSQALGFEQLSSDFQRAKEEEDIHLSNIRSWLNHMIISEEARAA